MKKLILLTIAILAITAQSFSREKFIAYGDQFFGIGKSSTVDNGTSDSLQFYPIYSTITVNGRTVKDTAVSCAVAANGAVTRMNKKGVCYIPDSILWRDNGLNGGGGYTTHNVNGVDVPTFLKITEIYPKGFMESGTVGDSVKVINLPHTVDYIPAHAFFCHPNLRSVVFRGLTDSTILKSANINDPDSIQIGAAAFFECKRLTSLTLPKKIVSIGDSAFLRTKLYNFSVTTTNGKTINVVAEIQTATVDDQNIKLERHGDQITITNVPSGKVIEVYSLGGGLIYSGKSHGGDVDITNLNRGVYIIVVGGKSFKFIV